MKIIDLYNKIANEGKIPKKIKFNGYEYLYHDKEHGYCRNDYDCNYICLDSEYYLFDILNDEVEILEEKKIPEKLGKYAEVSGDLAWDWSVAETKLKDKINEIIDCLDYLNNKGDK